MKIGFVLDDSLDKTDGVQQYVLTLGEWFSSQGHDVHYLVGHTKREDLPNVHSLGRNVQAQFNQNRMSTPLPASMQRIRTLVAREDFDVLHVQLPYSPFLAEKVIRAASERTAIIGTFHILPFSRIEAVGTRVLATFLKRSRGKFDHVLSVSKPAAAFADKSFLMKAQVVPNVVDVAHFASGKKLKNRDDKLTIVYLGRLVERKGCLHFLKAIQVLHQNKLLQDVRVVIAGKGPLLETLEAFVRKNRLGRVVKFVGYVPEAQKPDLFASADIAVLPSTGGESFGIVLVEAMASGAGVVIAGDNAGYRTVMAGHEEQLVNPADTLAFVKMLRAFIQSQPARKRAHAWQTKRAQQYDVRSVGPQILGIYEEVLHKKRQMR